jgi:hypothetical protein
MLATLQSRRAHAVNDRTGTSHNDVEETTMNIDRAAQGTRMLLVTIAVLAAVLGLAASPASADDKVGGVSSVVVDALINNVCCDTIASLTANFAANTTHRCAVNAAATMDSLGAANELYHFGLSVDDPVNFTNPGATRQVEAIVMPGVSLSVATTDAFTIVQGPAAGAHTFRFMARKDLAATANANVSSRSMTAVCIHAPNTFTGSIGNDDND